MNEIIPNLFLGSMWAGFDPAYLYQQNIHSVLQVCPSNYLLTLKDEQYHIQRWIIPVEDDIQTNLLEYFVHTCEWIQYHLRSQKRVLVHCMAGISRSATIVIAYIMWKFHIRLLEAIHFVEQKRSIIHPNNGFLHQLKLWEQYLFA